MNKQSMIDAVALNGEMSKKDAEIAIMAVFEVITETLSRKEEVQLINFGTFSVKERNSRVGRNPKTQEVIQILACSVPHFKAGKGLKSAVSGKGI
jgi:DNA-binding protein HU-beta